MNNITKYNIFILISTFSRNLIELFSSLILYNIGFNLKEIILFYTIYYLISLITSIITLSLSRLINNKYILIFSNLTYALSFYYLSNLHNNLISLFLFSIILAISNYTYHPIRHKYALDMLDKNKNRKITSILIFNYLAIIISSYLGPFITNHFGLNIVVFILIISSLISIIPLTRIKIKNTNYNKIKLIKINKNKLIFFILEQFKVIFLLLQPIYIYLYVTKNIEFVGIINVVISIAAILTIYLFSKTNNNKFKLFNIILSIILFIKINTTNTYFILIFAILEGIGIKIFEVVSTKNIYNIKNENKTNYLITTEIIFCSTSFLIFLFFYFLNNLRLMLIISIFAIFLCSFINLKIDNKT